MNFDLYTAENTNAALRQMKQAEADREPNVNRATRTRRRRIRSLGDLTEMTAQRADCASLAAANRAGFLTRGFQHADADVIGGVLCKQRACAEGFAPEHLVARLQDLYRPGRLVVLAHPIPTWPIRDPLEDALSVAKEGGVTTRWAGECLNRDAVWEIYGRSCLAPVVNALLDMWQVTVVELDWGSNALLWTALAQFAGSR
jgi:hypothetical protein